MEKKIANAVEIRKEIQGLRNSTLCVVNPFFNRLFDKRNFEAYSEYERNLTYVIHQLNYRKPAGKSTYGNIFYILQKEDDARLLKGLEILPVYLTSESGEFPLRASTKDGLLDALICPPDSGENPSYIFTRLQSFKDVAIVGVRNLNDWPKDSLEIAKLSIELFCREAGLEKNVRIVDGLSLALPYPEYPFEHAHSHMLVSSHESRPEAEGITGAKNPNELFRALKEHKAGLIISFPLLHSDQLAKSGKNSESFYNEIYVKGLVDIARGHAKDTAIIANPDPANTGGQPMETHLEKAFPKVPLYFSLEGKLACYVSNTQHGDDMWRMLKASQRVPFTPSKQQMDSFFNFLKNHRVIAVTGTRSHAKRTAEWLRSLDMHHPENIVMANCLVFGDFAPN